MQLHKAYYTYLDDQYNLLLNYCTFFADFKNLTHKNDTKKEQVTDYIKHISEKFP